MNLMQVRSMYENTISNIMLQKISYMFSEFSETQKKGSFWFDMCFAAVCYYYCPIS